jgi:nucleotide-binding universal stress UspA family protein
MTESSDILVASDLSARCDRALERACQFAAAAGATLHVLTVIEGESRELSSRSEEPFVRARAEADVADAIAGRPIRWQVHIIRGQLENAIVRVAAELRCRLVVAGIARNELLGRIRPGRTLETLIRRCPAPILIVKQRAHQAYQTVLVPSDYSAATELAVVTATELLPLAKLTLLHAYRVPFAGFLSVEENAPQILKDAQSAEREFVSRLEARTGRTDIFTLLIEYGDVDLLVRDFVRTQQPDCIVIGAHDQAGTLGWFAGGKADRLLMIVDCDVLVVPELIGAAALSN